MDQDQDVVDPSLRLSTVIPENMTPLLERPHHVTQNLVGNQIAIKWDLGWYVGQIVAYIPREKRSPESACNFSVFYSEDNSTHDAYLSVRNYSVCDAASSPAWCILLGTNSGSSSSSSSSSSIKLVTALRR